MTPNRHSKQLVNPSVTHGRQEGGRSAVDLPPGGPTPAYEIVDVSDLDLVVPEIKRTWERVNAVMPPTNPTDPEDPSTNLATLAAIAHAKWTKCDSLEEQLGDLFEQLGRVEAIAQNAVDRGLLHQNEWQKVLEAVRG